MMNEAEQYLASANILRENLALAEAKLERLEAENQALLGKLEMLVNQNMPLEACADLPGYSRVIEAVQAVRERDEARAELSAIRSMVVVVPERRKQYPGKNAGYGPYGEGWNACLDELARLNGTGKER